MTGYDNAGDATMPLPKFHYHEPASLDQALELVDRFREKGMLLAGGTDLLVKMKERACRPGHIISLAGIGRLTRIMVSGDCCAIGACCTAAQLAESDVIRSCFPALSQGANELGSPTVRNMGTIGGNIVTASPAADLPPALIAYGASVILRSRAGERCMPLEDIFKGPGVTRIKAGEILTGISMKIPPALSGAGFFKLGNRRALQISVINGACHVRLNAGGKEIETARIALGAVAPTPVRAFAAEKLLKGKKPGPELFKQAGKAAAKGCAPIDDLRGSANYRKEMVGVLTTRTLESAFGQIPDPSGRESL